MPGEENAGRIPSARERILDTASALFYRHGIHATGVDQIVAESGVAKMTLYKHFGSKEELVLAFLRRRDERWRGWFVEAVERLAEAPEERLLAIFDALEEWFRSPEFYGCAFINALAEFPEGEHSVHRASSEHKRLVRKYVRDLAEKASVPDPEEASYQLCLLMEGAIVTAQVEGAPEAARRARRSAELLLRTHIKSWGEKSSADSERGGQASA